MKKGSKHSPETLHKISASRAGKALGNNNGFKKGQTAWNKGLPNTWANTEGLKLGHGWNRGQKTLAASIRKMVDKRQQDGSYIAWNKGFQGISEAWNKGLRGVMPPPWNKGKPHYAVRGENNPRWQGGVTPINHQIRNSIEYKEWRRAVLKRDNYTCQKCGQRGGELVVDHELPFALFPDLRLEVLNGRALCEPCHKQIPTNNKVWKVGVIQNK